jgi:molecular chaperone DnaJ
MRERDPYKILDVERDASGEDIKRAFRRLARKYHPDANPGHEKEAAEKFKEVSAAYDVLKDPEKRRAHEFGGADFDSFLRDFGFGDMFANMNRPQPKPRGRNARAEIVLDLVDVVRGADYEVSYQVHGSCPSCSGTRSKNGKARTCYSCAGTGTVTRSSRNGPMMISHSFACENCAGYGSIPEEPCGECSATGRVPVTEKLKIHVPPGVKSGDLLQAREKGEDGPGGKGDLHLSIRVREHPTIRRSGNDLIDVLEIPFIIALRGGKFDYRTLVGETVWLEVPKGCRYGHQIVVPGRGILEGSLVITLAYALPFLPEEAINKIVEFLPQ